MSDYLSSNVAGLAFGVAAGLIFRGMDTYAFLRGKSKNLPLTTSGGKIVGGATISILWDTLESMPFLGGDNFWDNILEDDAGIVAGYYAGTYLTERAFRFSKRNDERVQPLIRAYDTTIKGMRDVWKKAWREAGEEAEKKSAMRIYTGTIPIINQLTEELKNGNEKMLKPVVQYIPDGITTRDKVRSALYECLDKHTIPILEKDQLVDPRNRDKLSHARETREKLKKGEPVKYLDVSL